MKKTLNKERVKESILNMVEDKKLIRSYLKGDVNLAVIENKGIKFAKPI